MSSTAHARNNTRWGYFFWMAMIQLALVLVGFGWSLSTGSYIKNAPFPLYLVFHGVILTLWFCWLVLQTSLVSGGHTQRHRKMGVIGIVIACLVVVSTPTVTLNNPARIMSHGLSWDSDMSEFPLLGVEGISYGEFATMVFGGNFGSLAAFAILIAAAVIFRKRTDIHKRLMLIGSLTLIPPAIARIARWDLFGGEDSPLIPVLALGLLLSILVYDWLSLRKLHPASVAGIGTVILCMGVAQTFAASPSGQALIRSLGG